MMTTGDILGYIFWGIVITAPFWIAYAATAAGDWLAIHHNVDSKQYEDV